MRVSALAGVALAALIGITACQKKTEGAAGEPAATAAAASAPAAPAAELPKRKPGLWSQTASSGGMTQTSKICLDAATDAEMSAWGQAMGEGMCSKNEVKPIAGGWKFEAVCDLGSAGTSATTGQATGDFKAKYVVTSTTVTTGSSMPQANGTHSTQLTAVWEGDCPADMRPGDLRISVGGGRTITRNLRDLTGMAKGK